MKIEVVEFYPFRFPKKPEIISGTMHIYICELNMDLRGIYWFKKRKDFIWKMRIPQTKTLDENSKIVFYPIINFVDRAKNSALKKSILEEGRKYLKEFYKP